MHKACTVRVSVLHPAEATSSANHDLLSCRSDDEHLLVVLDLDAPPFDELLDLLSDPGRLVFLDDMAAVGNHVHFVLALHMGDSEFLVHALGPCQEEHFLRLQAQELGREAVEPLSPELLRGHQVCSPHVLLYSCRPIGDFFDLGWHGDASTSLVADLPSEDAVLDH